MNEMKIAEKILKYSRKYREEHFKKYSTKILLEDPLKALDFMFGRVFYGGIWDTVATKEREITLDYIKNYPFEKIIEEMADNKFESKDAFSKRLKLKGVSNPRRGKMVYDLLFWLSDLPDNNCIKFSLEEVKNGRIVELFNFLDKEIYFIGPKKASFFLRDLVDHFKLEQYMKPQHYLYVLPIDTYVNQFLLDLQLKQKKKINWYFDAKIIVNWCKKVDISPINFDQGVWYAYYYNYALLD